MFCSKCNSEIPDGAKFCITCGEPVKQKKLCKKCGNELLDNMKFCVVCGARVEEEAPAEPAAEPDFDVPVIAPVISEESESNLDAFGSFNMDSPFSMNKPDESPQKMPEAAAAPAMSVSAVPKPVSASVPTPVPAPAPAPVPSGPAYSAATPVNTGAPSFAGPSDSVLSSGYVPPYNPPKASGNVQSPTVVSNAPAAAAVKKKSAKKPIIITIAVVLVAALAAGLIFFFTNKATVLSTIMGKSNYAAMIEGNSIKQAAEKLDKGMLSSRIKTAAGLYASFGDLADEAGNPDTALTMLLSDGGAAGNPDAKSVNLAAFFSSLNESMKDSYGVNSVMISVGMNAELTDTAKNELKKELNVSDEQLNNVLEYINGTKISAGVTSGESAAAFKAGAEIKGLKVDLKLLFNSKGDAYLVLPFASEKALLVKVGEAAQDDFEISDSSDIASLELDEKEIERLINEIVTLYIESYKSSEVEMDNGDLTVAGVTASGKLMTAELDSEKLDDLMSKIGEKLASDSYFKKAIVDYLNKSGVEYSESDYEKAINDAFSEIKFNDDASLKITTVINNSGDVLAKSYKLSASDKKYVKVDYAVSGDKETAFEIKTVGNADSSDKETASEDKAENSSGISVKIEHESKTNGTATVKFYNGDEKGAALKIKYKDVKTEKFCGKDISVGTYEISVSLPEDFSEDKKLPANAAEYIAGSKLTLSNSVSDKTCTSTLGVEVDKLGKVSFSYSLTAESNTADLGEPSSVIDLTPYMDSENEPDENFKKEVIAYLESVRDAISKQNAGELGDAAVEGLDQLIGSATQVSAAEISKLMSSISEGASETSNLSGKYGVSDEALKGEASALYNEYYELYLDLVKIYNHNNSISSEQYSEFKSQLDALEAKKAALDKKFMAAAGLIPDFSNIKADEIMTVLGEYKNKLNEISNSSEKMAKITANPELKSKYDECSTLYTVAFNSSLEAYKEYVKNGTVEQSLLDSARSSLQTFVDAYEGLSSAL